MTFYNRYRYLSYRYTAIYAFIFIFVGLVCTCTSQPEKRYRLIHNNDGSDLLGNHWFHKRPLSVNDVNAYVDMVSNSQVTTYMMCTGSDFFYYRSKYGRVLGDDLGDRLNCGCDTAEIENFKRFYRNFQLLEKEGTDIIKASLNRAKQNGMETFITYRMNDLHFNDTSTHCPVAYTDFWYSHPQYWTNDTTPGLNGPRALDFSHKEVRDRKLAIISEQLEKYDMIDGLDLDFMRFIVYFKWGEGRDSAYLMTQLVKDVRTKVDEISKLRKKKILLSARVPPTVEACLDKGLDIQEWIQLGLLDFVSIGVHWRGDPALPVDRFIKELGPVNIPIYASIDDGGYRRPREAFSHGMLRGMASHILAQGADGIILFNHYYSELNSKFNGQLHLEEGDQVCRVNTPALLQELGTLKTLQSRNKIHCLNDSAWAYGMINQSQLPLTIAKESVNSAIIFIGDNPQETIPQQVILFFRLDNSSNFEISVNGIIMEKEEPDYVFLYDKARGILENEHEYAYLVPSSVIKQGYNKIEFKGKEAGYVIKRLEIALKYGDVETHGYF